MIRIALETSEFGDIHLIIRNRPKGQSRTEAQLHDFTKRGTRFKNVMCCHSAESVKAAVRQGKGVGILFEDTVRREIDQGEFVAIQFAGLNVTRQTYIAYSKKRPLSPLARQFLSLLRASATKKTYP
jgi:DNA-binding transcriptional LysR family regulator